MTRVLSLVVCLVLIAGQAVAGEFRLEDRVPRSSIPSNTPTVVRGHIERLYSTIPDERADAAAALGRMGELARPALPYLEALLEDDSPTAVTGIGLSFSLRKFIGSVGKVAARAIVGTGKAGVRVLGRAAKSSYSIVRRNAAKGVALVWDITGRRSAVSLLSDADDGVRAAAAFALEALNSVLEHRRAARARDREERAREAALRGPGPYAASATTREFIRQLTDPSPDTRVDATASLYENPDPAAFPYLVTALKDSDELVRGGAATALVRTDPQAAYEHIVGLLKDTSPDVRCNALYCLGDIGDPRAAAYMVEALGDPDPLVRQSAVEELGVLPGGVRIDPVMRMLYDPDREVRISAVLSLGRMRAKQAVEPLIALLRGPDTRLRIAAAKALGWIGDARAVEPLKSALVDETVEPAAREALVAIAP